MATIINSTPRTGQPQQAVGIDWSNPITRDMVTCIDQNGLSLITSASVTKTGSFSTATTSKGLFLSNGADGVLSVSSGNVVAKSGSNFTVFGLVKTNSTGQTNKYIAIDKNTGLNKQTAIIYGYVANSIEFYTDNFTGTSPRTGSQLSIPDTNPHTFCYSYNGSAWKSYLDGSIVLNATRTFGLSTVPTDRFIFGSSTTADKADVSIGLWLVFNRALSDAEIRSISQNPWQIFKPLPRRIFVPVSTASGLYTLTAQSGSYAISGQQATLLRHRSLSAQPGSYSMTGLSASISYVPVAAVYTLTAQSGSYSITGLPAQLSKHRNLTASTGSYSLVGQLVTLSRTTLTPVYTLTAQPGTYSMSGNQATLLRHRALSATAGNYTYTGKSISISKYTPGSGTLVKYLNVLTGEVLILKPI